MALAQAAGCADLGAIVLRGPQNRLLAERHGPASGSRTAQEAAILSNKRMVKLKPWPSKSVLTISTGSVTTGVIRLAPDVRVNWGFYDIRR
jgi:hypothetical protein